MSDNDQWLSSKATQDYLQRGDRMIRKYASAGRLRTRLRGRRVEYFRPDIESLAAELIPESRERVPEQSIVPAGELLNHVRDLEQKLSEVSAQVGYLRGLLEERNLQIEEAKVVRSLLTDKQQEATDLQRELQVIRGSRRNAWSLVILLAIMLVVITIYLLIR